MGPIDPLAAESRAAGAGSTSVLVPGCDPGTGVADLAICETSFARVALPCFDGGADTLAHGSARRTACGVATPLRTDPPDPPDQIGQHLAENIAAGDIELDEQEMRRLDGAIQLVKLAGPAEHRGETGSRGWRALVSTNHRDAVMTSHPNDGEASCRDSTPKDLARIDSRAKALPGGGICPSVLTPIIFC
jgi:hypothetical protein